MSIVIVGAGPNLGQATPAASASVVSHGRMSSTSLVSARLARSQAS
jgi:hypothetical protein